MVGMKAILPILADSDWSNYGGLPNSDWHNRPQEPDGFFTTLVMNHHWLIGVPALLFVIPLAFAAGRRKGKIADPWLLMFGLGATMWGFNALNPVSIVSIPFLALGFSGPKISPVFTAIGVLFLFGVFF